MVTKVKGGVLDESALSGKNMTGDIAFDTTTLKIDASNNRVGIGTASPSGGKLHVVGDVFAEGGTFYVGNGGVVASDSTSRNLNFGIGNTTAKMTLDTSGKVGIGTTSPGHGLDVQYTTSSGTSDAIANFGTSGSGNWANSGHQVIIGGPSVLTYTGLIIHSDSTSGNGQISFADGRGASDSWRGVVAYNHASDYMHFWTNANERIRINSSGNVGIGNTSPTTNLSIGTGIGTFNGMSIGGSADRDIRIGQGSSNNVILGWKYNSTASSAFAILECYGGSNNLALQTAGGNVGIGISSPDGTCHIHSGSAGTITAAASGNNLVVENSGAVGMSLLFDDSANNAYGNIYWGNETDGSADGRITYFGSTYVTAADRQSMAFRTANTEAMRINSNGRVMVGTTSINGAMGNFVAPNGVTGLNIFQSQGSGSHTLVAFNVSGGGVGVGTITTNSSATAYNTSSDARLKNILGEAKGLEIINKLNPVNFEWKESKEIQDGLIAQEVMDIVPNAVTGSEEDYYQMDYSKLVTPLIKAIQELSAEVEELKAKLENK